MNVYTLKKNLSGHLRQFEKHSVGFVPTMGALHEGHLGLVKKCSEQNPHCVVSIFVNPTQFNNPEDLDKYPRRLERDLYLLERINPEITVYIPEAKDLYDGEIKAVPFNHQGLDKTMEGRFRPGHFDGVVTVVGKLFEAVNPEKAYFGEKDFQQLRIIQNMVEQLHLPVKIIPVEIYREEDGLAMSSRNLRLTPGMRQAAPFIYRALLQARDLAQENHPPLQIKEFIYNLFKEHSPLKLEYFEIADEETLRPAEQFEAGKHYRGFIAAYAGKIRLIDNIRLK
jgi:pantoate--beta-alanine ligase